MKRIQAFILLCCLAFALSVNGAAAENENHASIRDMMMTEKKAFSFRNGVAWGMNPQQVSLTEEIPMDFDPLLWRIIVEKVLVGTDGTVTFTMVGGKEYRFHAL